MTSRPSQGHQELDDGGLELWAPTEEALFGEAARAVVWRIAGGRGPGGIERRYLDIGGQGSERLRVWLDAVLAAAADGFVYADADLHLGDAGGSALVRGVAGPALPAPARVAGVDLVRHAHGVWARVELTSERGPMMRLPQPYEELEHTADLGVRVRGTDAADTLARLVCVFGRLLAGTDELVPGRPIRVSVPGGDLPLAAADVLRDLLYRFATERVVPAACRTLSTDDARVEVEVALAHCPDPEGADIKAVTLHQLRFEPAGDGWMAQVVFDV